MFCSITLFAACLNAGGVPERIEYGEPLFAQGFACCTNRLPAPVANPVGVLCILCTAYTVVVQPTWGGLPDCDEL
jgi:hypothetical protein